MYAGDTGPRGLHLLLFNLVTDSLDEAARGRARSVRVTLRADNSAEVADDGLPFYLGDPPRGEPTIESIFTRWLGHGPNPGRRNYTYLTYLVANALSAELTVRARTPGSTYEHTFRRGRTHAARQFGGPPDDRGLTVRFRPDPDIFGPAHFDPETLRDRFRECAFLHSGVRISFTDETRGTQESFEFADGIAGYVKRLNANRAPLHPDVVVARGLQDGVRYEVGLQWCAEPDEVVRTFANGLFTSRGGTHEAGLRAGVTRTVNDVLRAHRPDMDGVQGEDARAGLTAVVSVWIADAMFESMTTARLGNPEVEHIIGSCIGRELRERFARDRGFAECVVQNARASQAERQAIRAARKRK